MKKMTQQRIVVTGMGAVTPLGIGVSSYWENLLSGKTGISTISRFDPAEWPVKIAAEVKDFHPTDFLPKKLVRNTDLFMQFALAAAKEAIDESQPNIAPERIGVVLGTALGGIATVTDAQEQLTRSGRFRLSPHIVPKFLSNIAAAQIAMAYHFLGPSLTVSTACSSGADAVGIASMLLKTRQADVVVAVGAESILSGFMVAGLSSAQALSTRNDCPEKASRPFERHRDGFVIGEGGGAIVLETLESAEKRGAPIHGELLSYANTADAYHVTAPEPNGRGEIRCMQKAIEAAGLEPSHIHYINAHGTSTPLGDRVETLAIKAVFGETRAKKLPVSSTKGATGHMMGAGGVTELITCLLSIRDNILPPTLNYEESDPECDLDYVPNQARAANVVIAMSNSFGFGGQNATLIVGKYHR
jgi:3-oxoacyl-[acyl-carrier-protein] synthase II